jgi:lysophospholipase L1-like esterase
VATLVALGLAELLVRVAMPVPRVPGQLYFRDAGGVERDRSEALALGLIAPVHAPPGAPAPPRPRTTFAPGARFFVCYRDPDVLRRDWLDARGCVEVAFSRWGIREREEIGPDKPPGQRRVVCIGDSFTMGWGVRAEDTWVRRVEEILRRDGADVRTVNCGAAGAIVADEYAWALQHRFGAFQPDLVLVTLCLNDLLPTSGGLCQLAPPRPPTGSALLDGMLARFGPGPLDLDPTVDWVGLLMAEPAGSPLYSDDVPHAAMWSQGTPKRALREMRDWCRQRGIPFVVSLWPFLQGLGEGQYYPFAKIHDLVGAFCAEEGIPLLDLLPVLRGHRPEDLWVTPADMHANPRAQRLAAAAIAPFVGPRLPR